MTKYKQPYIIVALDFSTDSEALACARQLDPKLCRVKVGSILFTKYGPKLIDQLHHLGFSVFLDLKFNDIPNTVAGAIAAACELGVWMVNLHLLNSQAVLMAAKEIVLKSTHQPLLIGVTILTSIVETDLKELGFNQSLSEMVIALAKKAKLAELDGVVCSALEVSSIRHEIKQDFCLVTPGIRLQQNQDDQKRVVTPLDAIKAGSNYLVIGRPITLSDNPQQTLKTIHLAVQQAL